MPDGQPAPPTAPAGTAPRLDPRLMALACVVAFNLQSGIFNVGPLLPSLSNDLGLSGSMAGILAAIPALLMGLVAIPAGRLADRWGADRTVALGLAIVGIAGGLRGFAPNWPVLALLTVVFGAGTGILQPSIPPMLRRHFPGRVGIATGIFTFAWIIGIIASSGLTGPLIAPALGGWRGAFVFWGLLAIGALVLWLAGMRPWHRAAERAAPAAPGAAGAATGAWSPWRDRTVWISGALYAGQGLVYYLLVLWLPAVYTDAGMSDAAAGARLMALSAACIPATFLIPLWSDRIGSRRLPLVVSAVITLASAVGFVVATTVSPADWLWPALAGFGTCGILVTVLVLVAELAPAGRTGDAAGVVMAIGYIGTTVGPILAGLITDLTGSPGTAMLALPVAALAMTLLALAMPTRTSFPAD
ncbi:MAG: CynX/NimT family MFS transporter [Chloroflexota bacterium]